MARITSIAELAAKPGSGVDHVKRLAPALTYDVPAPRMHHAGPVPDSRREWVDQFCAQQTGHSPAIDLYRIDECLVTVDGAIMTMGNHIIKESLFPYMRDRDVANAFNPNLLFSHDGNPDSIRVTIRGVAKSSESVFFGREHGEAGYFHWLHSVLPRVAQYRNCGLSRRPISLAITEQFQGDSLSFMGLGKNDVQLSNGMSMLCNSLYFCTPMVSPDMNRSGGFFERALFASDMLRSLGKPVGSVGRKILISRKDAKIRRLLEEEEVGRRLKKAGFECVVLTGMPFKDQVSLFASASTVVSMHGAGLSNVAFMPKGGVVIELLTPDRLWPTFRGVAVRSGLHYVPYVGNKSGAAADRDSDISVAAECFSNFVLDADQIGKVESRPLLETEYMA
ncbi:MAG: glycosyltransferase family 61 protein [Acetobacteraceae bacterium]|nr:glycosyltransferase family 61 protein [Acetobacteraceae bacterium]